MATIHTKDSEGTEVILTGPSLDLNNPPSNKEIKQTLKDTQQKLEHEKPYLSPQGQNLVDDANELADAAAALLKEKNKHERFQKLYLLMKDKVEEGPSDSLQDAARTLMNKATGIGSELKTDAQNLQSFIRGSVYNLLMSTEYRQLAFDFITILKDLALEIEEEAEEIAQEFTQSKSFKWDNQNQEQSKPLLPKPELSTREEQHIEALRDRFNDFLRQLRSKKEYQMLMDNFFKYSAEIYNTFKDLKENPPPETKDLQKLIDSSYGVLGDFAGEKIVKKFRSNLHDLFTKLYKDAEINAWFQKAQEFITEALKKPDQADTEETIQLISELIRTGRKTTEKYRENFSEIYDQIVEIFQNFKEDQTLNDFGEKLVQLGKTMALNRKGEPDPLVMQESASQITTLLVRLFNDYLIELPIQQVEIYSKDYDDVLRDIKTQGMGFAPESIEVSTASRAIMNLKNRDPSRSVFRLALKVDNIAPEFKDFAFYFNHKTFPSYEDSGRADLIFDNKGLSARVVLSIHSTMGRPSRAKLDSLTVTLDKLTLNIGKETKHEILSTLAAPIFSEVLRSRIERTIWNFLRNRIQDMVSRLNMWFESNPLSLYHPQEATFSIAKQPAVSAF